MYHKIETAYNKLSPILKKHYSPDCIDAKNWDLMLNTAKLMAAYNNDKNTIVSLFHYNDFSVSFFCKNGAALFPLRNGTPGKKDLFYGLDKCQLDFPEKAFKWLKDFTNNFKTIDENLGETMIYFCGLKLKSKDGGYREYFISQRILSQNKIGLPISCITYLTDVTHLLRPNFDKKNDFYWSRMVRGDFKEIKQFRSSQQGVAQKKDIVTKRELEVLKLINTHKESREIASLLNISINTVDKHRKNMLARTRAKDTTALIQLCKMAGLL